MPEIPYEWKSTYNIKVYEADAKGRVNASALANYLQNSAWDHYKHVEKALGTMLPQGCIWLMTRLEIDITSIPQWPEDITVETWSRGIDRLLAYRDYIVTDGSGKEAARATTTWAVIDTAAGRIQRLDELSKKWPSNPKSALGRDAEKLPAPAAKGHGAFFPVRYSELDLNRHVNNAKYVQWISDSYPMEFFESNDVVKLEVNFMSEANYGDEVCVNTGETGGPAIMHNIIRKSDGKEICRARLTFK